VVTAHITGAGLSLLQNLDAPVAALHRRMLGHLGPERLAALADGLLHALPESNIREAQRRPIIN
jgi:hypothetical protein